MACLGGEGPPSTGFFTEQAASLTRGVSQTMLCTRMKMLGALIVGVLLAGASVGLVTHRLLARETSEANDGFLAGPADGEKGKGTGRDGHKPGQPGKEAKGSGPAPAAEKPADKKCLPPV